jgi:hypothetical protein
MLASDVARYGGCQNSRGLLPCVELGELVAIVYRTKKGEDRVLTDLASATAVLRRREYQLAVKW